jgi:hypothetical protein
MAVLSREIASDRDEDKPDPGDGPERLRKEQCADTNHDEEREKSERAPVVLVLIRGAIR